MNYNYLKIALRYLFKNKAYTFLNSLGLALGLAVAALILSYVQYEFGYDQMHQKADRIYRVESQFYEGEELTDDWGTASFGYASAMQENLKGIEAYVRIDISQKERTIVYEDEKHRETKVVTTEPAFLSIFSFPLLEGNPDEVLTGPNKVVITQPMVYKYFRDKNPLGKILRISTFYETLECEVTGVLADLPANAHFDADFFISWETLPNWKKEFWYLHETYSYVLLEPGTDPTELEQAFPTMAEKYKTRPALKNKTWAIQLNPLSEIHLTPQKQYEREVKGNRKALNILIWVAIAILIIAWINYINLKTAKALERAKEIGIRKVSGAHRGQLIVQFMVESLLVNVAAFVLALGLIWLAIPFFNQLSGLEVGYALFWQAPFWLLLGSIFTGGLLVSGLYPAWMLSSVQPLSVLKGRYSQSKETGIIRKGLIVFQFIASFALICGTLVAYSQLRFMQNRDLGVQIDQSLVLKYPSFTEKLGEKLISFQEVTRNFPEVSNVTISNAVPGMAVAYFASNHKANDPDRQNRLYEMLTMDHEFVPTYGLEMAAGRAFSRDFPQDSNRLVLNEAAVQYLELASNEAAIGEKIMIEGQEEAMQVIGVVKNYHQQSPDKAFTPIMGIMNGRIGWLPANFISIRLAGRSTPALINRIQDTWAGFFPNSTFDYFFLKDYYDQQYQADRRFMQIFGLFSGLSLLVACIGLFGLVAYTVTRRTKEIGIRKIMGADARHIVLHLSKNFTLLIVVAALIGIPLSYWGMGQWLQGFAYRIDLGWKVFGLAFILLLLMSWATIAWQVVRAALANPVEALREE